MIFSKSEDKKALSDAYASMMLSSAWKDLERFLKSEHDSSVKRMDDKSASILNIGEVCEERGIRKGIMKVLKHASQQREGI